MNKLIRDLKSSSFNSFWGRIGLVIAVIGMLIGHYIDHATGYTFIFVVGAVAWAIARFLDWKRPIVSEHL